MFQIIVAPAVELIEQIFSKPRKKQRTETISTQTEYPAIETPMAQNENNLLPVTNNKAFEEDLSQRFQQVTVDDQKRDDTKTPERSNLLEQLVKCDITDLNSFCRN